MGMLICRRMANGRSWDILVIHPFGGNRDDLLFQQVPSGMSSPRQASERLVI
jgi:hypothetical protein